MMNNYIKEFPQQLLEAIKIGEQAKFNKHHTAIHHILVIGMGGSGIGANFAKDFTEDTRTVPMLTHKGYETPKYINEHSLVICSSYSGNTEETLTGFEFALSKGAKVVCISSGGQLIELAKQHGLDYIQVPNFGAPPRACLGYSVVQQLFILKFFGHANQQHIEDLKRAAYMIGEEEENTKIRANRIARFLVGKFPILYTTERTPSVAVRLRQQLNENAKILCSHHIIPEMNHNELVGWRKQPVDFAVLLLRTKDDHPRNSVRAKINKEIIGNFTNTVIDVSAKGDSLIEQSLYFVSLGDWISWEVSQLRQVDAMEVKVIDHLKGELAKVDL
ncbi:MAG: bifunctional phosphoglucose/phosphomannose isomerase [Saprospiraceae bacterium]|nr:bifunctional phosphoglucose/phosphomannose isomerase [Saprospiraceae bacterium]